MGITRETRGGVTWLTIDRPAVRMFVELLNDVGTQKRLVEFGFSPSG